MEVPGLTAIPVKINKRVIAERLLAINTRVKALGHKKAQEYVVVMAKELARF